ncbi:RNA-binding domain-containing protein [uncultured Bacteroides sp.]|uniref:RNA-binding domain-containing protein n=1 Tax=uncultured Bacteroides sp. TaxID=162156 RepID=UPI0025E48EA0|nr:RNA-binding domain-containing protein [uncultured Bacteroides sp.]
MTEQELLQMRDLAEAGQVQFKERANDRYDIGCEMVAFSNTRGGKLIIGINDKSGTINALSYKELQETTNLLTSIASENVIPNILIDVDNVPTAGGAVVVATIPEGKNKPYHDNKGIIWVKNGADKRKVFDNSELAEMMSECGNFDPDEAGIPDATIEDLDTDTIKLYLMNRFVPVFKGKNIDELNMKEYSLNEMADFIIKGTTIEKLLRNLRFIKTDGKLTIAAMLLFGKYTQRWLPVITAKCICFMGNSIGGTQFRDKMHDMEIEGNLLHQFRTIMSFFTRNLRKVQVKKEFNSIGELEIPYESLTEYVVNALVHRSLNIKAPIRIFIFDNRVEIHSPGALPNGLTIEDIKNGTSMPRNMFLFTNANYLLPYTGAGSGVRRALEYDPNAIFFNGIEDKEITHVANEFVITIPRNKNQNQPESNLVTNESNQANENSNQAHKNLVTHKLTKKEEDIRNFCSVPRTAQEIMDRLGISNQSKNRQKYITSLIEIGVLERTIPEKPSDPNQKYRRKK